MTDPLCTRLGWHVIVEAFLRWAETARTGDRARAANALGRAFLRSEMSDAERRTARVAMTYLLDDPSPRVRLALCEALAESPEAPRPIMVSLAQDQAEIACHAILRSPVLGDSDLVDLVGRGSDCTRALIAARPGLSRVVAAALAEVADRPEILILLENDTVFVSPMTLRRLAERHGRCEDIRNLLLEREALPAAARQMLVAHVTEALVGAGLVQAAIGARRIERIAREAGATATLSIAGSVSQQELPQLVEHLRVTGRLTPAFLMHALCSGKTDFFAAAIVVLSGLEDRRARALLATGRRHAVRALMESAGLDRDVSEVFVEAIVLWRHVMQVGAGENGGIASQLLATFRTRQPLPSTTAELLEMVEQLQMADERQYARSYASGMQLLAAE